ncbi:MBL fold metallo-hydrolase [Streptomyces somaliensis DSM 40738]|uniref:MBL fold metallo-hydrolase n=1 Tax=Streptomyces somaliensis (strain ATCC 33201 / DSM 40738 / JCM 12659 / KCTC 9044 / NCTC 11332 / NRRL B-12077 / IP 733) TaxID=1134445 RepID=A0AA44DFE6_STRE0|nr:MBL fold metallo-hydrolase [Streptomyces somaliensis]MCQ0021695.1 MBL fold metallo-hydrolase [Streptomyces somaliensis DSM 40738]NKY15453.1 MBL fold metallo-hydrolase [Streptomyces somaliensis DSM 40738]
MTCEPHARPSGGPSADPVPVLPGLHVLRFPVGRAYVWRDDERGGPAGGVSLTLVDAGWAGSEEAVARALHEIGGPGARLRRIVLTHAHRDHVGAAGALAGRYGAEVLAHRLDAPVVRGEAPVPEPDLLDWEVPLYAHGLTTPEAPPTRVDRELEDGDVLDFGGGARVVHTPGHTPGSIALHLPRHGVLVTGDTVASVGGVGFGVFHVDRAAAVESMRRLAALRPLRAVCFGHGDPLTEDASAVLRAAAEAAAA